MMIRKPEQGNPTLSLPGTDEMSAFASALASVISPDEAIALIGPMGVGKTTFTKSLCTALGVNEPVQSPTFTLLNRYESVNGRVYHGDLYRLVNEPSARDIRDLTEELAGHTGIILMEWADLAPELSDWWTLTLTFSVPTDNPDARFVEVHSPRKAFDISVLLPWMTA